MSMEQTIEKRLSDLQVHLMQSSIQSDFDECAKILLEIRKLENKYNGIVSGYGMFEKLDIKLPSMPFVPIS